ncbi:MULTISPECIES: class I SAM-dependent rRNA methyltransferase [unclassified Neptuniibacter]|jgi:23S rRNA (cytosine1962-C5)-methyltransferase|uniref:class I SAM-dependent rRNA methyltransferase n=1 Tax=unclassified Neptuniibacter TaxID=2630693 RepID=UPI0026E4790B|nr:MULTISPECIES: class I SAM-dependent rRNA methyltransferase [unclassified Neptuniibacter]MDO6514924.1 class I SAM-dependent rRNA methyltransferase [Neptuniibacter sp. 2_MG-2023]MDO6594499.1 class I SAM-dependent rRNA methyltransferase [Neptuniibacter sp. 1_MG-2023]
MSLQTLKLNSGAERRLRGGHLWIYSNEVDNRATPLKSFAPGEQVIVETDKGKPLGVAYVNPNTLICGRIVSRDLKYKLDRSLIIHRLKVALSLRESCFSDDCYRLVFGDSDGLPGLVIDRFYDIFVVQISTAGMEAVLDEIIESLNKVFTPKAILLRNDGKMRDMEGLETYTEVVQGDIPELCPLMENSVSLLAPLQKGQKTGWFYDHRNNRAQMQRHVEGKRVLDLFSYVGGWGAQALAAGASQAICVDASHFALEVAAENARINNAADRFEGFHGDAFDICKSLIADKEKFDMVVLDPPAFIQKKKDIRNGERAYARMNNFAMRLLKKDGILVSASCSMHLERQRLVEIIRSNSRELDRNAQIFDQGHQGADHPVHPAIPETDYLKSFFVRVLPSS